MIKVCCDICGKEIDKKYHAFTLYKVKRKKYLNNGRPRWEEIIAHDYCVQKLLEVMWEKENDD